MTQHALVTGANGFVGRHLVAALAAAGWCVDGVVRHSEVAGLTRTFTGLDMHAADLVDVNVVFHLAGLAHAGAQQADRATMFDVNVAQSVALYEQAAVAGVERFVYVSSIKVLGDVTTAPFTAHDPLQPGDVYAQSKARAEMSLLAAAEGPTQLCIVRSPLVYGVGVRANFLALLDAASKGWPLPLALADAPRAWLGMGNLIDFLNTISTHEAADHRSIWHVRDDEETSVRDMLVTIAQMCGQPARLFAVNPKLAIFVGKLMRRRAQVERLFCPLQVDMQSTVERLGWRPVCTQSAELEKVVAWYRTQ